jgi:hypothetical protein
VVAVRAGAGARRECKPVDSGRGPERERTQTLVERWRGRSQALERERTFEEVLERDSEREGELGSEPEPEPASPKRVEWEAFRENSPSTAPRRANKCPISRAPKEAERTRGSAACSRS